MDNNIYVYIGGTRTSLVTLAASSGISYETILARYKAGVSAENLTADALDTEPVEDSEKAITSGAVYTAVHALDTSKIDKITSATAGNVAMFTSIGGIADSGIAVPKSGTWTANLQIDGTTVATGTGSYTVIADRKIITIPVLSYQPASAVTPTTRITITGLPFSPANYACVVVVVFLTGTGFYAIRLLYSSSQSGFILYKQYNTDGTIAEWKPTIPAGGKIETQSGTFII